jgi:DNA modification methylase
MDPAFSTGEESTMLEINKIHHMDCVEGMKLLPENSIDLTVTSPPYDNLRSYNGFNFDIQETAKELYRVTKNGGIVVWVVSDATVKGSETGTSFKQALCFKENGFNIHDTMIWAKDTLTFPDNTRYGASFEYMFVFSKGKPKTFNPIMDRENKWAGTKLHGTSRGVDGQTFRKSNHNKGCVQQFGKRYNVWNMPGDKSNKTGHPAVFPERLASDHIVTWSNKGDVVLDPFIGSGTTAKMAKANNRNYIGFEISVEYCDVAELRLAK